MRRATITLFCALSPAMASAIVIGDTNLGIMGYPEPQCTKPMKPTKPYSFSSSYEVDSYNSQVRFYNLELDSYVQCIRRYLDAANSDIERIKEKMDEAVKRAKSNY